MWSNDIKCKYMFMFPLNNLARKELMMSNTILHIRRHHSKWSTSFSEILPQVVCWYVSHCNACKACRNLCLGQRHAVSFGRHQTIHQIRWRRLYVFDFLFQNIYDLKTVYLMNDCSRLVNNVSTSDGRRYLCISLSHQLRPCSSETTENRPCTLTPCHRVPAL